MNLLARIAPAAAEAFRAHREAARFAATVRLGDSYFSVSPSLRGGHQVERWTFDRRNPISGQPACGHQTAEAVWLGYGPLYPTRAEAEAALAEIGRPAAPEAGAR
jgi:hypothetical protein